MNLPLTPDDHDPEQDLTFRHDSGFFTPLGDNSSHFPMHGEVIPKGGHLSDEYGCPAVPSEAKRIFTTGMIPPKHCITETLMSLIEAGYIVSPDLGRDIQIKPTFTLVTDQQQPFLAPDMGLDPEEEADNFSRILREIAQRHPFLPPVDLELKPLDTDPPQDID